MQRCGIEEGGIERLNTNLVAAESGINISTVYKYFPNKLAILATLFERQSAERTEVAFDDLEQCRVPRTGSPDRAAAPPKGIWGMVDGLTERLAALLRERAACRVRVGSAHGVAVQGQGSTGGSPRRRRTLARARGQHLAAYLDR